MLSTLHVEYFDTSRCTNFSQIFMNVGNVIYIKLLKWDVSNASGSSEYDCGMAEAFSLEGFPYKKQVSLIGLYYRTNTSIKVTGDACKLSKCFAYQEELFHIYAPPNTN